MLAFKHCKDREVLLEILKQKPDLDIQNRYKFTVTMLAFKHCKDKEVLLEILKQKPNLDIQNDNGLTVIFYAIEFCNDKEVLLEILKQKPNLNNSSNIYNMSIPLHAFLQCTYKEVLFEILNQKPDLNIIVYNDKSILHYAFQYYINSPEFDFQVLEKLYDQSNDTHKELFNLKYIKLRRKYKVMPLVLFRHHKRYGVTKN